MFSLGVLKTQPVKSGCITSLMVSNINVKFLTLMSLDRTKHCQVIKNSGTKFVDFTGVAAARDKDEKKKVWNHYKLPCKESWKPQVSAYSENV